MAPLRPYEVRNIPDLRDMLWGSAGIYGTATAFREKKDGFYQDISYGRLREDTEALGLALRAHIAPDSHVLVIGKNSYDRALAFLALICGGGIPVPADTAMTPKELAALAAEADATTVLYAAEDAAKIAALPGIVSISFAAFPGLIAEGKEAIAAGDRSFKEREIDPNAPAALFYTSGTTGNSKGVMLSHKNMTYLLMQIAKTQKISSADTFLSILPLSHIYECMLGLLLPLYCGARIAFAEGLSTLMRNMRETHPTCMVTVPYLAEAILDKFWQTVERNGTETEVRRVIAVTDPVRPLSARQAMKERLLAGARLPLGGKLSRMLVVGDFLAPAAQKGLRQIGIAAIPGYGLTECAGLAALGREELYRDGTVGFSFPDSVLDIYNPQPDGSGEIRCKGDNIMLGYYKNEVATKAVVRRGWYYTGDMGKLDENGFLHIIGRKQNCLEMADGKIICPEELETLLSGSPLIRECVVVGVPDETCRNYEAAALIYPDRNYAAKLFGTDVEDEDIEDMLSEWIKDVNTALVPYKQISLFALRQIPFPKDAAGHVIRAGLADELQDA